jgi:cadmium resistance protein CadD (predicted permease)
VNTFIQIALVTGASFLSTSADNLVLLAVLLGQRGQRSLPVMLGYLAAALVIGAGGLVVARLADAFPPNLFGFLGLVPLGMGAVRLTRAIRGRESAASAAPEPRTIGIAGVALLMLANSSDTFLVLLPLFAETPEPYTYVMVATIAVVSIGWFGLALAVGGHPRMRGWIERVERWLVPVLLIGVGLYVLSDTATDTLR